MLIEAKGWRVFAPVRAVGVALLLARAVAIIAAGAPPPETEELVEGVRFLVQANTLEVLRAASRPDFAWTDDDGVTIFLWAKRGPQPDTWHFTIDSPHLVQRKDGKPFWCLLDPQSGADLPEAKPGGLPFGHPISQFFVLKFVREELPFPGRYGGDGNHDSVTLLSKSDRGEQVIELAYCSTGGARAHQEGMKTYLLYVSPEGRVMRASEDLGHQGSFPHGAHGANDSLKATVVWKSAGARPPFTVKLRRSETEWLHSVDEKGQDDFHDYTIWRDGELRGDFPMRLRWERKPYIEVDRDSNTLTRIADALAACYSTWADDDVTKKAITARWLAGLQRLNSGVGADAVLANGRRLVAFEDAAAFGREIHEAWRSKQRN